MRVQQWLVAGALMAMPALAAAQTTTTGATTTTAPTKTTTTRTVAQTTTTADFDDLDSDVGGWFASAHVASDFGLDADSASVGFGGALGYTNGWIGGEFLAGFSPNFQVVNPLINDRPQINSYMANLIASVPIGDDRAWQPFVSGGLGALTLRSDALEPDDDAVSETFDPNDTQMGANVGFGVMGFARGVGLRADLRYFRAFRDDQLIDAFGQTDSNTTPASQTANAMLSGLDFWRANIGLAFRW